MNFVRAIGVSVVLAVTVVASFAELRTTTNLPYRFPQMDAYGNTWMLYNGGRLMQQGNMPLCSDWATVTINGQGFNAPDQNVAMEKGEAILENLTGSQFSLTRRFLQSDDGVMRIIEVIRNNRAQEVIANVTISSNVNFGVQTSKPLTDPGKSGNTLGTLVTDSQNRNMLSVFAGRASKLTPTIITAQPNNTNIFQALFEIKMPANKEVAIVHFHKTGPSPEQADEIFATLRESRAISRLPAELRRIIVNYPQNTGFLDDLEILRGGATDVVELANGDQLRGDLLNPDWNVQTAFSSVQIPTEQVVGMLVASGPRPRQLVITTDGEIIGGKLLAPTIDLQISSGQKISIPVSQITRMGRRTSAAGEVPAISPKLMLHLRTGDRLAITLPPEPIKVATRFGVLELPAQSIASIDLQPEQSPVHIVSLIDGSRFSGLLLSDAIDCTLARGGKVSFPLASVRRLAFVPENESEPVASLRLTNDDSLAAVLPAKFVLLTSYGEVNVNGAEVKRITRVKDTLEDIQAQLWDDSTISGRLAQPYMQCTIGGSAAARVPVATIDQYNSSAPQPAAGIVKRIEALVAELNADDWKQRKAAEATLLTMGEGISTTLKQLRDTQPPEAQQRIDSILKQLSKSPPAPANPPAGVVAPRIQ